MKRFFLGFNIQSSLAAKGPGGQEAGTKPGHVYRGASQWDEPRVATTVDYHFYLVWAALVTTQPMGGKGVDVIYTSAL